MELPHRAPCATGSDMLCEITEHGSRERQTGPEHPLTVIQCKTHGRFFTIYPPGFVPFGRKQLPIETLEVTRAPSLQAAVDAADERQGRWPDWLDPEGNEPGWASTQWRQIVVWGRWLGLTGTQEIGQQIATVLGVALHEHAAARSLYQGGTYRHRGRAILSVVQACSRLGDVLRRLLRAGFIAGLVGRGYRSDRRGHLVALVVDRGREG
ncbi:MAG: hypothetical protein GXP62_15200 [Oligoflexia bacterium]|nr:hypothetical protein [Oligoflexia bacterium]